jgi:hypothetical protein
MIECGGGWDEEGSKYDRALYVVFRTPVSLSIAHFATLAFKCTHLSPFVL